MGLFWQEDRIQEIESSVKRMEDRLNTAIERIGEVEGKLAKMRYAEMKDIEDEMKELRSFFSVMAKAFDTLREPEKDEDSEVEEISA